MRPVTPSHIDHVHKIIIAAHQHRFALIAGAIDDIPHTLLAKTTPFWPGHPLEAFPYIPDPHDTPYLLWPTAFITAAHIPTTVFTPETPPADTIIHITPREFGPLITSISQLTRTEPRISSVQTARKNAHIIALGSYLNFAVLLVTTPATYSPYTPTLAFPSETVRRRFSIPYAPWGEAVDARFVYPLTHPTELEEHSR